MLNIKLKNKIYASVIAVVMLCISASFAQNNTTAVLIQQTPIEGGIVTPGVGVQNFSSNSVLTLNAVPKPGYQFVYWIGDVTDPTSNRTTATIKSPKIIIAVFQRVEYDFLDKLDTPRSTPGAGLNYVPYTSGEGLYASASNFGSAFISAQGNAEGQRESSGFGGPPNNTQNGNFPAPERLPEPASIILLSMGILFSRKIRNETKMNMS